MNISYSRVAAYLRCPYSHYLGYEVGVKRLQPERPLYFGTDFHKLLELRNRPDELAMAKKTIYDKFYELPPSWQADLGANYYEDLTTIFEDYCELYRDAPQPTITEQEFSLSMGGVSGEPLIFKGVIDEVYKRKDRVTGERFIRIGEHKTFTRAPSQNTLVMNTQKNLYAKAVQEIHGFYPRSVLWDYIHSTPAAPPIWLEKSQKFSEAKSEKITPASWKRACLSRGITDPEIIAKGDKYAGNVHNFFFRCDMDIVPEAVDRVWDSFVYTAREIGRQGHKNKSMNITRDCSYCSYRDICYTLMTGGSLDYLLDKVYTISPRDDIENKERRKNDGIS